MAAGSLQQHSNVDEQQLPSSSFAQVSSSVTNVSTTLACPNAAPTSTLPPSTTVDNETSDTSATDGAVNEEEDEDDEYRKIQKVRTLSVVNIYYLELIYWFSYLMMVVI